MEKFNFKDINFGFSSAETERAEAPELLEKGFFDYNNVSDKALNSATFLFLGYKGSGKSAIAERLSLLATQKHNQFVSILNLSDFPFTSFSKIIRGDLEPEAKYPDAWSWILLIYLLESLRKDEGLAHPDRVALQNSIQVLSDTGLLPNVDLKRIVRESSKKTFKLVIPKVFEETTENKTLLESLTNIPNFLSHLKKLILAIRSESKHYIVIDGLDEILTQREIQYKSLGSLIFEISRLNQQFRSEGVPAKFIVLCRTDLFVRISGANKNKVRQDSAVELDWYHDTRDPADSALVHIANLRGSLARIKTSDIFKEYFPDTIEGGDIHHFLLDYTRHTPRDFLQLLKNIQSFYEGGRLSRNQILSGIRQYSIGYFLPEIVDELEGYFDSTKTNKIFEIMTHIQKRDFSVSELVEASQLASNLDEETVVKMLNHLFDCSAIGNIQNRPGGTTFYTFKFRNRHSTFNQNSRIMLHKGLWKALNLI